VRAISMEKVMNELRKLVRETCLNPDHARSR
jgi:hypothetical protein